MSDRFDQRVVIGDVCRVAEFDVVRDHLGARTVQFVDHACVIAPRKGKRGGQAVVAEVVERALVDVHEHDAGGPLAFGAADLEARVDRLLLGTAQQVVGVGEGAEAGGDQGDREQQRCLASLP